MWFPLMCVIGKYWSVLDNGRSSSLFHLSCHMSERVFEIWSPLRDIFFVLYFYHTISKTVQNNFYEVRKAVLPVLSGKLLKTSHVLNTSLRLSYLLESNTVKKTFILWNLLQSISGWSLTRASLSERGIPSRARRVKNRERKDEKTF